MTDSKTEEWQSRECSMGTRAEDNSPEAESRFDKTKMTDGIILDIEANRELQRFQEEDDFELILTRMEVESGISSSNTSLLKLLFNKYIFLLKTCLNSCFF